MIKAFVTVGLGFGDEGKGSIVAALCNKYHAKLVVRYSGGAQCAHNVIDPNGNKHSFAQFGSGTFQGIPTWLASSVIIDPLAMRLEADKLELLGCKNLFLTNHGLTAHSKCLVATPYQAEVNQSAELYQSAELSAAHGSCGMGIGATRKYWLDHGEDSIFAKDLKDVKVLQEKLELMRQRYLAPRIGGSGSAVSRTYHMLSILGESSQELAVRLASAVSDLRLRDEPSQVNDFNCDLDGDHCIVYEGAQGILLDENYGYHPHTTWSDVTPRFAIELCNAWGISDRKTIGVLRSYMTRHGRGPLPTGDYAGDRRLLELVDDGNPFTKWQGKLRHGIIDLPLIEYAADAVRTICPLDYLAVNCLDELPDYVHACYGRSNCNDDDIRRLPHTLWTYDPIMLETRVVSSTDILTDLAEIAPIGILGNGPDVGDKEFRIE